MINILTTIKDEKIEKYTQYLHFISEERRNKIHNYRRQRDKLLSLFAELLIRKEVIKNLLLKNEDIHFKYLKYGKPTLKNHKDFNFSISHTDSAICVITSNLKVGIDIEKIKNADLNVAKRYFDIAEYEYIISAPDQNEAFFKVWTQKEAYVKLLGTGLSTPFSSFNIFNNNLNCCLKSFIYHDYIVSAALEQDELVKIQELSIDELLQIFK